MEKLKQLKSHHVVIGLMRISGITLQIVEVETAERLKQHNTRSCFDCNRKVHFYLVVVIAAVSTSCLLIAIKSNSVYVSKISYAMIVHASSIESINVKLICLLLNFLHWKLKKNCWCFSRVFWFELLKNLKSAVISYKIVVDGWFLLK